jgi:hypothetical protein
LSLSFSLPEKEFRGNRVVKEEREREREGWHGKFGEITKQARGVQSRTKLYCSVILFMVWLLAFVNSFCLRYIFFIFHVIMENCF